MATLLKKGKKWIAFCPICYRPLYDNEGNDYGDFTRPTGRRRMFCSVKCKMLNHRWEKWCERQKEKQGGSLTFVKAVKNGKVTYQPEFRGRPKYFVEPYSKEWHAYFDKYAISWWEEYRWMNPIRQ